MCRNITELRGLEPPAVRPTWRGVIHRSASIAFVPVVVVLLSRAHGGERPAVLAHAVGVVGMLAVSGTYHSGRLSPGAFRVFKRIDHATILAAIGGTYAAITVLALDGSAQARMLLVVGIGAALGVVIRMAWLDAPYPVVAVVYLVVGWSAMVDLPGYLRGTTTVEFTCVIAGGLLYTAGGVVYALHRPVLRPATFGYHELFHALVVAGATAHVVAVALLL